MKKLSKGIKLRKFLHLLTAIIPVIYIYLSRKEILLLLFSLTIISYLIDILRLEVKPLGNFFYRIFEKLLWEKEKKIFTGASTYVLSAFLSVFLFSKPIAITALLFLSVGDTVAYFVGTRIGRISLYGEKTLEGSLSCFLVCVVISLFIHGLPIAALVFGAVGASLVELFPFGVDDNLLLPLVSGLIMESVKYLMS